MKNITKIRTLLEAAVVIAVALAFIMPGAAVFANTTPNKNVDPLWAGKTKVAIKEAKTWDKSGTPLPLTGGENIQITGGLPGDDIRPAITKDKMGDVFITWQNNVDISTTNAGFTFCPEDSVNDQETWWTNEVVISLTDLTQIAYPDSALVEHPDYQLMGAFLGMDTEVVGGWYIPDMDYNNWEFYTWNNGAPEPKYAQIADGGWYQDLNYPDVFGPFNMFIHREIYDVYDISDCPICFHTGIDAGSGVSYFDAQSVTKTAPAKDPDMVNFADRFHTVIQYTNVTTGPHIVWKEVVPAVQPDYEYTAFQKRVADGSNPAIAAYGTNGQNVAIAYVNLTGAVRCVYSIDEGVTWTNSTIAPAGSYPEIYAHRNKFYAAYINEGNLFVINSTDGATWGTPTKINNQDGTVVAEENSVDIHDGGIVWVDSRNTNTTDKDIYYYQLFLPVPAPKLTITITPGFGIGVKAVVKNNGNAVGTDVDWEIKVIGGIFGRINKTASGTIASLAIGAEESISSDMILGLGSITITAKAICVDSTAPPQTKDGTQLFIFTSVK
jgi:hypothetical protein